jgi:hypothetical protein
MLLGQRTRTGLLLITLVGLLGAEDPAPVSPSRCPRPSRAELFLRSFAPPANSDDMRATTIEQDEQVYLAFGMIDFIQHHPSQPAATKVGEGRSGDDGSPELDAERIAGFLQTIRDYDNTKTRFAVALASLGRASDAEAIGRDLSTALSIGRQDGLMGHEELAFEAQKMMQKAVTDFSAAFAKDCKNQSFDTEFVFSMERKNELLGTNISVIHCAQRKYIADLDSQGVHYHFETCTIYGAEPWKLTVSGLVTGSGKGTPTYTDDNDNDGFWSADTVFQGYSDSLSGSLRVTYETKQPPAPSSSPPNPPSPTAQPNNCPQEKPPALPPLQAIVVRKLAIRPIIIETGPSGKLGYYGGWHKGAWLETEIKTAENKPCDL